LKSADALITATRVFPATPPKKHKETAKVLNNACCT
jgi:hypothetical protein